MPYKPNVPCKHPGCPKLVPPNTQYCDEHKALHPVEKRNVSKRESASSRGYGYKWQKARKYFLNAHPLCEMCKTEGRLTKATVVDHIIPHRGNKALFWDRSNWQSLCKHCHDVKTATEERYVEYKY